MLFLHGVVRGHRTELWFSDPLFLLGLLFVPLVFLRANARPAAVTWSSLALVETRGRSLRARLVWLPAALLALATACLALALYARARRRRGARVRRARTITDGFGEAGT